MDNRTSCHILVLIRKWRFLWITGSCVQDGDMPQSTKHWAYKGYPIWDFMNVAQVLYILVLSFDMERWKYDCLCNGLVV